MGKINLIEKVWGIKKNDGQKMGKKKKKRVKKKKKNRKGWTKTEMGLWIKRKQWPIKREIKVDEKKKKDIINKEGWMGGWVGVYMGSTDETKRSIM